MNNKQIIKQIVNGVEKLLVVNVIEEIDVRTVERKVDGLTNEILEINKQIEALNNQITELNEKRDKNSDEIVELKELLNGVVKLETPTEPVKEVVEKVEVVAPTVEPNVESTVPRKPYRRFY